MNHVRNVVRCIVFCICTGIILTGCGRTDPTEQTSGMESTPISETEAEDTASSAGTEEEPTETFTFFDVNGEPYVALLQRSWPQNQYLREDFTGDLLDKTYSDDTYESRLGLDAAKYQGEIDWKEVSEAGIEFAVIRIGFRGYGEAGTLNPDPMFEEYWKGAGEAGIDRGIYFFSQAVNEEEASAEAEYVLELLDGRDTEMPVYFDEENITEDTARTDYISSEQFTANAAAFCRTIEAAGYDAGYYANTYWNCLIYDQAELAEYKCWLADYSAYPQTPYAFEMWQFTESADIPGVKEDCDLNLQFIKK